MSNYEQEVEKLLADDSFIAWIEGQASEKEAREWETWLEKNPTKEQLVEEAKILHSNIKFKASNRLEIEGELAKLNDKIDRLEIENKPTEKADLFRIGRSKTYYSTVAAVVVLLITVLSLFLFSQTVFLQDNDGEKASTTEFVSKSTQDVEQKELTLFDGSKITLNANSSIKYPATYSGGDLEISLEGEAYFDIVHQTEPERTFTVNVPNAKVKVLGTEFNVNAYKQDTEIMLIEGSVNIELQDSSQQIKNSYVMKPGELSRISQVSNEIITRSVKAEIYTSWTQGKIIFKQAPLSKVAERVGHIFGVRFQLDRQELKEITVSGSLPNNNLNVFLQALEDMLNRPIVNNNGLIVLGKQKSTRNGELKF